MFKPVVKQLYVQYILFWLLPILILIAFETGMLDSGFYAGDGRMEYMLETISILITIVCVPLALKLFSVVLIKRIDEVNLEQALNRYVRWSGVRLLILEVAAVFNLVIYYLLLTNVGILCAGIAVTASLFCWPGEQRLREELNVTNDE